MTCALIWRCCTSLVVSSHDESQANILNEFNRLEGIRSQHFWKTMTEGDMRAMQHQFTTALDSLIGQNIDLNAELAQSRQQSASVISGVQDPWRDCSAVFQGYAGAA